MCARCCAIILPPYHHETAKALRPPAELLWKLPSLKFEGLKDLPRINPGELAYKTVSCGAEIVRSE
jgi:hypothetical protein